MKTKFKAAIAAAAITVAPAAAIIAATDATPVHAASHQCWVNPNGYGTIASCTSVDSLGIDRWRAYQGCYIPFVGTVRQNGPWKYSPNDVSFSPTCQGAGYSIVYRGNEHT